MANFKICVRGRRKDGFYPVYIRVSQGPRVGYIRTEKVATDQTVGRNGEVTDPYVVEPLTRRIREYGAILNRHDTEAWTVRQVIEALTSAREEVSFSEYAVRHIDRMFANGQHRTCANYRQAVAHLERYLGTTDIRFPMLTARALNGWLRSLEGTSRAKEMYPVCVRQIFKAAVAELNDEDSDFVLIKNNPWPKVRIPKADTPDKRAIPAEACREFFSAPLPESKMRSPLAELGRDVAMLCLCLAGINTVDLYGLRREDCRDGVIRYRRAKTRRARRDEAYIEMRVPSIILPLLEKYAARPGSPLLFDFAERFSNTDSFCSNVNTGIKKVCESMGIPKENRYCVYTFRHTWATTAQNDCGATFAELGFAMNHSQHHGVTRGYVIPDFTPAWELNERVVDFIFFSDKPSKLGARKGPTDQPDAETPASPFRLSPKMLIRAAAFFRGKCVASFEDIGCSNIDEVISRLASELPVEIPPRSMVQFKIVNLDNGRSAMYERMKGKGF